MTCCTPIIQPFANQLVTTVPYIGNRPTVDVLYLQTDGTFIQSGIFTQIEITPTDVIVTHGEASTGIVKLLQ